jgi:hypothetical protein
LLSPAVRMSKWIGTSATDATRHLHISSRPILYPSGVSRSPRSNVVRRRAKNPLIGSRVGPANGRASTVATHELIFRNGPHRSAVLPPGTYRDPIANSAAPDSTGPRSAPAVSPAGVAGRRPSRPACRPGGREPAEHRPASTRPPAGRGRSASADTGRPGSTQTGTVPSRLPSSTTISSYARPASGRIDPPGQFRQVLGLVQRGGRRRRPRRRAIRRARCRARDRSWTGRVGRPRRVTSVSPVPTWQVYRCGSSQPLCRGPDHRHHHGAADRVRRHVARVSNPCGRVHGRESGNRERRRLGV